MGRRFVNQLGPQESVREIYQAHGRQLRPNRNGNLYLQVELSDRTGSISCRMWNATEGIYNSFEDGQYVLVDGATQVFQGALQMIAKQITPVLADEIDPSDFIPVPSVDVDQLLTRVGQMLRGMMCPHLRNLAECFLMDDVFIRKFSLAPAGVKNHHAYHGGLLEHVVNVMELVVCVAPRLPAVDPDLLLMGAFLHDLGKIEELSYDRGLAYTDEGQLIGHLIIGVEMLDAKLADAQRLAGDPVPLDIVHRLKHMIVSHHGTYEYGSPKLPMTMEAIALHHLDNLDAKVHAFALLMQEDLNADSHWTQYHQNLGRKLYKNSLAVHETEEVGESR